MKKKTQSVGTQDRENSQRKRIFDFLLLTMTHRSSCLQLQTLNLQFRRKNFLLPKFIDNSYFPFVFLCVCEYS